MNKIVKKNAGYTSVEILYCIAFLGYIAMTIGGIYVVVHFICKFW